MAAEAHREGKKGGSKKKTFNSAGGGAGAGGGGGGGGRTPDDVKYQVVRLMRMLVQLCHTLDEVPEEVRARREARRGVRTGGGDPVVWAVVAMAVAMAVAQKRQHTAGIPGCPLVYSLPLPARAPSPLPRALSLTHPLQRFLFIKLTYHDHTPSDYEPPHFHAVTEDGIGHFPRRPFAM